MMTFLIFQRGPSGVCLSASISHLLQTRTQEVTSVRASISLSAMWRRFYAIADCSSKRTSITFTVNYLNNHIRWNKLNDGCVHAGVLRSIVTISSAKNPGQLWFTFLEKSATWHERHQLWPKTTF